MSDIKQDAFESVDSAEISKKLKDQAESSIESILSPSLEVTQDQQKQLELCSGLKTLDFECHFEDIVEVHCTPATQLSLSQLKHDYILTPSESKKADDVVTKQGAFLVCLLNPSCTFDSALIVFSFRVFISIYTHAKVDVDKVCIISRHECKTKEGVVTVREKISTVAKNIKVPGSKRRNRRGK